MATQKVTQFPAGKQAPGLRNRVSRMTHLTPDELLSVPKASRARSARDWAMVLLAYRHGLRASEVCDLKLTDVDLRAGSVSNWRLKGSLHTVQPLYRHKGQPLLDEVTALRAWMREREPDGSDYLFLSQKGGRLHRSQFFRIFQACAEDAGLPPKKRHPHWMKHSLASDLVQLKVNLSLV